MAETRYHHGNLRAALLETGLRMTAERGAISLQVRDLAKEEGVSPSAVYRHFPDLAHLSAEVSRLARERLAQAMLDAAAQVPEGTHAGLLAIRRFDAIGRAYVQFAVRERHLFDIAFQAPTAPPSCADAPSAWDVLIDALDALVAERELSPALRPDAPIIAWSAVHGLASIFVRALEPEAGDQGEALDALMRGVRRALGIRDD
jgi:AcrR family transcriptional regulator